MITVLNEGEPFGDVGDVRLQPTAGGTLEHVREGIIDRHQRPQMHTERARRSAREGRTAL